MRYFVLLLTDPTNDVIPFTLSTDAGDIVLVFEDQAKRDKFIELAGPLVSNMGRQIGYLIIDVESEAELHEKLRPAFPNAQIMFDSHPDYNDLIYSFGRTLGNGEHGPEHSAHELDNPPSAVSSEAALFETVWEAVTAATWDNMRQQIAAHPELHSDLAQRVIESLSTSIAVDDAGTLPLFEEFARILKVVQANNIDAVFESKDGSADPASLLLFENLERLISPGGELSNYLQTRKTLALHKGIAAFERLLRHRGFSTAAADLRAEILHTGSELHFARYQAEAGPSHDIDRAIEIAELAVAVGSPSASRRARCSNALGMALSLRFERAGGRKQDLDRSIAALEDAVAQIEEDDPARSTYLNNLALALYHRFKLDRNVAFLDRGIALLDEAVERAEKDSDELPRDLSNLCLLLASRASEVEGRADADRAIEVGRCAVSTARLHPHQMSTALINLAQALQAAFKRSDERTLLDEEIAILEQAKVLVSQSPFALAVVLRDLGVAYRLRFGWSGDLSDLESAVGAIEKAITLLPRESGRRRDMVHSLIYAAAQLGQQLGGAVFVGGVEIQIDSGRQPTPQDKARSLELLNRAVDLAEEEVSNASSQSELADSLEAVAAARSVRGSTHPGFKDDFETGRRADRRALDLTPKESPRRAQRLARLASSLQAGSLEMQAAAASMYEEAIRMELDDSINLALFHATAWANWKFREKRWLEAKLPYTLLLEARRRLIEIQLARGNKETWLSVLNEPTHYAAYSFARSGDLQSAVLALEEGRAHLLTATLLRDQSELASLQTVRPDLHERYVAAGARMAAVEREELRENKLSQSDVAKARAGRIELEAVLNEMRLVPGFENFLRPPVFKDVEAACSIVGTVPIVYLTTTSAGSLALVVVPGSVEAVWSDLNSTSLDEFLLGGPEGGYFHAQSKGLSMASILDRILPILGEQLIGPLAAHLRTMNVDQVVLIPAGKLGALPLHAATYEVDGHIASLIDEFDVAFSPNARVLSTTRHSKSNGTVSFLGIGNPLPHPVPLDGAQLEVTAIASMFPPGRAITLVGTAARANAVLPILQNATHIHFACHGGFNSDSPLDSSLELGNGDRIRLRDLLGGGGVFGNARLVVLSACQSGVTESQRLPDEFIGLPAAFLQGGVPGVVGSLWEVADLSTALLMIRFYQSLSHMSALDMSGARLATALCAAQRWVRTLTSAEIEGQLEIHKAVLKEQSPWMNEFISDSSDRPFADPYFWAPFAFFGI